MTALEKSSPGAAAGTEGTETPSPQAAPAGGGAEAPQNTSADSAAAAPQNAPHAISFEYVGGHIYGVATTRSLTKPQWAAQPVRKTETDADRAQVMPSADEEDVGETTIYVVPAEGATSQFFKLEAK